jgi:3-oxoacyl-[acyl-carrier protein] reductase
VDALVYDVSAARDVEGLVALYDFLHEWVPRVVLSGRIVMVACAADPGDVESAAVLAGLEGLTRSLAREVGRRGTTVQLVVVERGGEDPGSSAAVPVLRWLLSDRSAFVSGQTVRVPARELGVVPYLQPLAGRVAVVTGAARGIGSAVARALAREGARVIGVDLPDSLAGLRATMGAVGGTAVALDVTAPEAAARIRAALETYGGGLDLLVHDAAVTRDRTLVNLGRDDWNAVLQVNLAAPLALTRELLPAVRGGGRIVALSSIAGLGGNVGQTHYAATKAGLVGWAAALGPTLAARGITVNAVAPGIIETRMLDAMPPAVREVARRFNALSQAGLPEDVAEAILFLCTPGAAAVSGTCLRVCGLHLLGA